jgi:hypothetical protein
MVIARLTGAGRVSGAGALRADRPRLELNDGHALDLQVFSERRDALRALGLPAER